MLVIRLARTGKKKQAFFRIVVADKRRAVGAKFVEILGNYNPHAKKLDLDQEKLNEYMKNGAQPSNTLAKILKKEGVKLPKWVYITEKNKPAKKVEEAPEAPKAEESVEASAVDSESIESAESGEVAEEAQATEVEPAEEPKKEAKKEEAKEEATEEPKVEEATEAEVKEDGTKG